ncbi:MAG: hypothetical protein U1F71_11635 [Verrucomicrobiaceae bacterium]
MKEQLRTDAIYGRSVINDEIEYKLELCRQVQPQVVALGSSRVLDIRGFYFKPGIRFISAGRAMDTLPKGLYFARELRKAGFRPELVVFGVDFWWFNPALHDHLLPYAPAHDTNSRFYLCRAALTSWQELLPRLRFDASERMYYEGRRALGSRASSFGEGFISDGSYWVSRSRENRDMKIWCESTLKSIAAGEDRWSSGDAVSSTALLNFEQLMKELTFGGTRVVLFLPPLAPEVVDALEHSPKHGYVQKVRVALADLCKDRGWEFHDMTRMSENGPSAFSDGIHGGQSLYIHALSKMPGLRAVLDEVKVKRLLNQPMRVQFGRDEAS